MVLPYIKMNLPRVYMCSPSWTLHPPPSPFHPSGSSQCTSPKHPVSCIESGLATHFIYDIIHISMPFSQIIPPSPSPSPTESKRLFYTSVSLLLSHIQGYCYHLSKFHIYALVFSFIEWVKMCDNILLNSMQTGDMVLLFPLIPTAQYNIQHRRRGSRNIFCLLMKLGILISTLPVIKWLCDPVCVTPSLFTPVALA